MKMKPESFYKIKGWIRLATEELETAKKRIGAARKEASHSPTFLISESYEEDLEKIINDLTSLILKMNFENKK